MDYEILNERDMSADRSTSSSNPTQELRNAIKKYEYVIELVDNDRVYICDIINGKLSRKRKKDWEDKYYRDNKVEFFNSIFKSLGTHEHSNSEYVHKILVSPDMRLVKAMKRTMRRKSKRTKVIDGGWEKLVDEYRDKVEIDIWDIDNPSDYGRSYKQVKVMWELIRYAKENNMDIDTAMTALDLKSEDEQFSKRLEDTFIRSTSRDKYKIYKDAKKITESMKE